MSFNVTLWPIYGLLLGVNYSTTTILEEDTVEHELQIAFFIFILEISWES
jgi:hypothetical protein